MKTILTIFSGRRPNLEILYKYLKKALEANIIDEIHLWNYTKKSSDEEYIKSISNIKRTSSTKEPEWYELNIPIINNGFSCKIRAKSDINIKFTDKNENMYDIILGALNNNRIILKKNDVIICDVLQLSQMDEEREIEINIRIESKKLNIYKVTDKGKVILFQYNLREHINISETYISNGKGVVGHFSYTPTKNCGFYFMDTCNKTNWKDYYYHYDSPEYSEDVILKCDDDIVFMDIKKLPGFIEYIKENTNELVFANTINNGVAGFFQQEKFGLIPKEVMVLEYPQDGMNGSLWSSGEKAAKLHRYFIANYKKFLEHEYNKEIVYIPERFSINFFGYRGNQWHKIKECYSNDEYYLTQDYVWWRYHRNHMYSDFYVSHLSFYKQIETGIPYEELLTEYNALYQSIYENENII